MTEFVAVHVHRIFRGIGTATQVSVIIYLRHSYRMFCHYKNRGVRLLILILVLMLIQRPKPSSIPSQTVQMRSLLSCMGHGVAIEFNDFKRSTPYILTRP